MTTPDTKPGQPRPNPKPGPQRIPVWSWRDAIRQSGLPPYTRLLLHTIACHLSDAGRGWSIRVRDLIEETGMSNTAVAQHLKSAVAAGYLEIERTTNDLGHRTGTIYRPRFPEAAVLATAPADMQVAHTKADENDFAPNEPETLSEAGSFRGLSEAAPRGAGVSLSEAGEGAQVKQLHDSKEAFQVPFHSIPPLSPSTPDVETAAREGGRGIKFSRGWNAEAREAAAQLAASPLAKHVVGSFLAEVSGTLNPPVQADPASYVRQLGAKLGKFPAETLAKVAARVLAERARDLPAVAELERLARGMATGPKPGRARPEFQLVPTDVQWRTWMAHLRQSDPDLAAQAEADGCLIVNEKWPVNAEVIL